MGMADQDFQGNLERFSGFADEYDQFRPEPPGLLGEILIRLARVEKPDLVIDLGSGTGLSTRYWSDLASRVIGVEPSKDMRQKALSRTSSQNIMYKEGFSHQTGLPDRCAQIVTCSQALHWMEPQATFLEARRILQPGGVFAAFDYDWPPSTGYWEADAAYDSCIRQVENLEARHESSKRLQRWAKSGHLKRMQASGCFRYTKEIVLHHIDQGNAERMVGLLMSQGSVMSLVKSGISEEELGISQFRKTVMQVLGNELKHWYWSSRVRLGIV